MATAASFTNHFITLFISFAVLQYLIWTYAMDPAYVGDGNAIDYFRPDLPHDALPPAVLAWERRGQYVTVTGGLRVFVADIPFAGPKAQYKGVLLAVHGFPSSSYDYSGTADALAQHFRVVSFDFIGFGLSAKPPASNFSYSLSEQADVMVEVWSRTVRGTDSAGTAPLHLMAHDMGDTIAQELLARKQRGVLPEWLSGALRSVTLNNGGIIAELHTPRISQLLLRIPYVGRYFASLMSYPLFKKQLKTILAAPDTFPEHEIADMYALVSVGGGHRRTADLIGYIGERHRFSASRWLPALLAEPLPVHLVWGAADTVAPVEIAHRLKRLAPHFRVSLLHTAGHFAMIEQRDEWLNAVLSFEALALRA